MKRKASKNNIGYQRLECRKLFAGVTGTSGIEIVDNGSEIQIVGTEWNDEVRVFDLQNDTIRVSVANELEAIAYEFAKQDQKIRANLFSGDDFFATVDVDLELEIYAGAGNDLIIGGSGNDTIVAGEGDDRVESKDGDDLIYGGPGHDLLFGESGHDTIFGGLQGDQIFGGPGDDKIKGAKGLDTIYGEDGSDSILGSQGADIIFGGNGNDHILGGEGGDLIRGGAGNDILSGQSYNPFILPGGINLAKFSFADYEQWDYLDYDRIFGDEGADRLFGHNAGDKVVGGSGNDGFRIFGDSKVNGTGQGAEDGYDDAITFIDPSDFKNIDSWIYRSFEGGHVAPNIGGTNSGNDSNSGSNNSNNGLPGSNSNDHNENNGDGNQASNGSAEFAIDGLTNSNTSTFDFGIRVEGQNVSQSFTIQNTGNEPLYIDNVQVPWGLSLEQPMPGSIAAGDSFNLIVNLDTSVERAIGETIRFETSDADRSIVEINFDGVVIEEVSVPTGTLLNYDIVRTDQSIMVVKSVRLHGGGELNNRRLFADFYDLNGNRTRYHFDFGDQGLTGNQVAPVVRVLSNDNFAVGWIRESLTGSEHIHFSVINEFGSVLHQTDQANLIPGAHFSNLDIVTNSSGFVIQWRNENGQLRSRNYNNFGNAISGES